MPGASTIIVVREDFSIPGADDDTRQRPADAEQRLLSLIRDRRPDVIVLDLRDASRNATSSIRRLHDRSDIPILVVCDAHDQREQDYRIAGATECLPAPVDMLSLNTIVQKIIRATANGAFRPALQSEAFEVEGMLFQPRCNALSANGCSIRLTTAENHLLLNFLSRPWIVCRRAEIAEVLYDQYRPTTDRAIDVVVTRLRKKLTSLRGPAAGNLIKTEFRHGYMFAGDVSRARALVGAEMGAS
jgi:two-component system OmpR family response regulator